MKRYKFLAQLMLWNQVNQGPAEAVGFSDFNGGRQLGIEYRLSTIDQLIDQLLRKLGSGLELINYHPLDIELRVMVGSDLFKRRHQAKQGFS